MKRALLIAVLAALALPATASAADVVATTTTDDNDNECVVDCTLREALFVAGPADRVVLLPATYTLSQGPLIFGNDTVVGAGARATVIDGANSSKVISVSGGASAISGVTITRGNGLELQQPQVGGAIVVRGATAAGSLTVTDSTITGNTALAGGGIAVITGGTLSLVRSTVSGNVSTGTAGSHGGGIYQAGGVLSITNSTISGNIARDTPTTFGTANGGGIYVSTSGTLTTQNVTLSNNRASTDDGLFRDLTGSATVTLRSTIVHSVPERSACGGNTAVFLGDHNLSDDSSCGFTDPTDKLADARLGGLANNGGPTDTHALGAGSAAIGAGASCPATDQRGVARDAACDMGAFEYRAPVLTVVTTVVNDHGFNDVPSDFTVRVAGNAAPGSAGTTYTLVPGTYVVAADARRGYTFAYGGACGPTGSVTLGEGSIATCTVVANDPAPSSGRAVNALPARGTVRIRLPGSNRFRRLAEGEQLPTGTTVDTLKGRVTLIAAGGQRATFYDGIFRIAQGRGAKPLTTLSLVEALSCPKAGRAIAAAKKKKRRLWGDGSGKFRVKGKHSAATVVGTKWLVEDRCTSTLTRVTRGRVSVRDLVKKKTVLVRAGKRYTARAKRR